MPASKIGAESRCKFSPWRPDWHIRATFGSRVRHERSGATQKSGPKKTKHRKSEVLLILRNARRFQQSSKSSGHPSALQPGAKSESLREEMEEAATRMEICRVRLAGPRGTVSRVLP